METIHTQCPACATPLEVPRDFDNLICGACGAAFHVRRHGDAWSLAPVEEAPRPPASGNGAKGEASAPRPPALDEEIGRLTEEIALLRSRERGAPLAAGCAFFGIFSAIILVFAFYATIGRSLFGSWLFYLSLAAVVVAALWRARGKLVHPAQLAEWRARRRQIEERLRELEASHKPASSLDTHAPDAGATLPGGE